MKILITGRHESITQEMRDYARTKVEKLERIYGRVSTARVTLDVNHNDQQVEIVLEANRGVTLVSKASGPDMNAACDLAEQRLAQQLRRHKERLRDHHRGERRDDVDVQAPTGRPRASKPEVTYEEVVDRMREGRE